MVPEQVVKAMMELSALSFVLPVVFVILWRIKSKKSVMPSLTGALVLVTFGIILKSVPDLLFLSINSPVSRFIKGNMWIYALYAGLMAGIFEETGRFVSFKLFLKRHDYRESAIAYGLGHGGLECMIVLGLSMLQNFTYAQVINAGKMEEVINTFTDESAKEVFRSLQEEIINLSVQECAWAGIERISALVIQVSLSVVVYYAANIEKKKYFLAIAIALHTLVDIFAAFYQQGILPLAATEIIIMVFAAAVAVFAYKIYHKLPESEISGAESQKNWKYASMKYQEKETAEKEENNESKTS